MTREEFIKKLEESRYSYKIEGDKIVVTHKGHFPGDSGDVNFQESVGREALTSLPPGVVFENEGYVHLGDFTSLPPGVVFKNRGTVWLRYLTSLPSDVVFKNRGDVYLESLIGGWLVDWNGNIEGIDSKKLLNKMIKDGLFER